MEDEVKKIYDYSLEDIMGERFGTYSKFIIQDRAIPDVRDGLKPVQRRILYAMLKDGNTHDKHFKKCANAVGVILGKYHPHGDSSVYEALVRLSQDWKQNEILVEISGNNGSIDGDPPAAYRYTECRLTKISEELLGDVDKFEKMNLNFAPNFDDSKVEPTVLPCRFPNLLVNGTTGISAGYATNMPPHNLGEIIDATIKRIDSPNCSLDTILNIVKGPDFPTGGIIEGVDGLRKAYETGRGKIFVKSKYEFVKEKGKEKIVIDEIPFDVNKKNLVQKIDEIRYEKKIDGIQEVRDESDKDASIRIVIDLKSGANKDLVMNYLLKNTDLLTTYNFNNVTIVNRRPRLLGILPILDAYIEHQKFVVRKVSEYDLEHAKAEKHITEGLVKAISILDEVIKTIRESKNKADAKENLVKNYDFTSVQAEEIVMLQLYRLTNTDIVTLEEKLKSLSEEIERLEGIINDESKLNNEIKSDLRRIKKEYATPRKTVISDTVTDIKIDTEAMIIDENVYVVLSKDGYLKRVSEKSFKASNGEETGLKPGDVVLGLFMTSTLNKLLIITNLGNYLYIPVHEIGEAKWKEMGKHISNIVTVSPDEKVINAFIIDKNADKKNLCLVTKNGMIKKSLLSSYIVSRYNKAMTAIKLKENDEVVSADIEKTHTLIVTKLGYYVLFETSEIPQSGVKTSGVKGINLKDDEVVSSISLLENSEYILVVTGSKTAKRIKLADLEITGRAKRGNTLIKKVKSNPYNIISAVSVNRKDNLIIKTTNEVINIKSSDIPIADLLSTGKNITDENIEYVLLKGEVLEEEEEIELPKMKETPKFEEMTIDDFLNDFKL